MCVNSFAECGQTCLLNHAHVGTLMCTLMKILMRVWVGLSLQRSRDILSECLAQTNFERPRIAQHLAVETSNATNACAIMHSIEINRPPTLGRKELVFFVRREDAIPQEVIRDHERWSLQLLCTHGLRLRVREGYKGEKKSYNN